LRRPAEENKGRKKRGRRRKTPPSLDSLPSPLRGPARRKEENKGGVGKEEGDLLGGGRKKRKEEGRKFLF